MSTSNKVHSLVRLDSRWLQLPIDLAVVVAVWWFAFWLGFNLGTPAEFQSMMVQTLV